MGPLGPAAICEAIYRMPDPNQQSSPGGDGVAAIQARLSGGSTALLRAIPDEVVSDPKVIAARRYRRRVLLTLASLAAVFGLYWGSSYVFAYTDDAYVTSDLVGVAPWITGRIVAVPIVDNQTVTKGMLLAEIDPTPFRLSLDRQIAKRVEAETQLAVDHDLIKSAKAARDAAAARARLANDNLARAQPVANAGFLSRQALDFGIGCCAGGGRGTQQCPNHGGQRAPDGGVARGYNQGNHRRHRLPAVGA